ncbi:hypothetical protein HDU91_001211 [Kappamyces sp. JEL0680]|nr:hypothetical protein HDU91_001211 [Kappamyces sp. JEL0680]
MLIFVLPIVCDYVLERRAGKTKPLPELALEIAIVLVGVVGGAFGTYDAVIALANDIAAGTRF